MFTYPVGWCGGETLITWNWQTISENTTVTISLAFGFRFRLSNSSIYKRMRILPEPECFIEFESATGAEWLTKPISMMKSHTMNPFWFRTICDAISRNKLTDKRRRRRRTTEQQEQNVIASSLFRVLSKKKKNAGQMLSSTLAAWSHNSRNAVYTKEDEKVKINNKTNVSQNSIDSNQSANEPERNYCKSHERGEGKKKTANHTKEKEKCESTKRNSR